jgi:hypothetical protein
MRFDPHEQARRFIDQSPVAGISREDAGWLRDHTSGCAECYSYAELTARILAGLNSFSFEMELEMNARVQGAVAAYAQRLADQRHFRVPTWRWIPIAAVLVLVAVPIYKNVKDQRKEAAAKADALLLEGVETRISRAVPKAMEPLLEPNDPPPGESQ